MRIKQAAIEEKKEKAKQDKVREKAQAQAQSNDIRRLALANRQAEVGVFRDLLSDPCSQPSSNPPDALDTPPPIIQQTLVREVASTSGRKAILEKQAQKLVKVAKRKANLKMGTRTPLRPVDNNIPRRFRSLTPPPQQMELIRPSKQNVRIPMNVVESTPPKRMRVSAVDM